MPATAHKPTAPRGRLLPKVLLAFLSPLLFLLLAEGTLRAFNIGYPTSFLVPVTVEGEPYWSSNPFYGYRFFHPMIARNPSPISIKQKKAPGTIRVVVLGESAAQGDPMLDYGIPRMLEKMLNQSAGTSRYEVVNAAMTAINSHVIVDIARDLLRAEPDIAVIYMGNNEVIGPFGPGTTFTTGKAWTALTPLRVMLSHLRITQVAHALRRAPGKGWSGLDMFKDLHLTPDDPALSVMYKQFGHNLAQIIRIFSEEGIEVWVSTVAVNLSDCPPFSDKSRQASALYREAKESEAKGDYHKAHDLLKKARDLDAQRFRTDARQNSIIRETAQHQSAQLVDAEVFFNTMTPQGRPPGDELFLDHVHFTFEGTWQLSRLIAAEILETNHDEMPSLEKARELMFFTPWAERNQALVMLDRRQKPPLAHQINNNEQIEKLSQVVRHSARVIREIDLRDVEQQFELLHRSAPDDFFMPVNWGAILMDYFRWSEAIQVMRPALKRLPLHPETRMLPAVALAKSGKPEEAARIMAGASQKHGYYLAEYSAEVMHQLERDGYETEATGFRNALLELVPRFIGRERFER